MGGLICGLDSRRIAVVDWREALDADLLRGNLSLIGKLVGRSRNRLVSNAWCRKTGDEALIAHQYRLVLELHTV
jgi:hypothetical protein